MERTEAIRQVLYRCVMGMDEDDFEVFAGCFTDDAVFETSTQPAIIGRDAIVDFFSARRQARRARAEQSRHLVTNVVLLETAEAEVLAVAYVTSLVSSQGTYIVNRCGWYRDRLVKDADETWRIAEHFVHMDGVGPSEPLFAT